MNTEIYKDNIFNMKDFELIINQVIKKEDEK